MGSMFRLLSVGMRLSHLRTKLQEDAWTIRLLLSDSFYSRTRMLVNHEGFSIDHVLAALPARTLSVLLTSAFTESG